MHQLMRGWFVFAWILKAICSSHHELYSLVDSIYVHDVVSLESSCMHFATGADIHIL